MRFLRLPGRSTGLGNFILRTATLGFRSALSFYIVKYLGYQAAGLYGLTIGVIALTPALFGWGLNYFVFREVVGLSPENAVLRVKNRLFVTLSSLTAATVIGILSWQIAGDVPLHLFMTIIVLAWLETIALDLQLPLIGMEKSLEANLLVFIRSALWVPVIIVLGMLWPRFQTIEAILAAWTVANALALGLVLYIARHWQLRQALYAPIDFEWIRRRLRGSWYIYLSDLGIVGLAYLDRYIVSAMLGLAATGLYTFFWSLTNSLQTLVGTAVVQLALPELVKTFQANDQSAWRSSLLRQLLKTAIISTGMAIAIFIASEIILQFLSIHGARDHQSLFIVMLCAAVLRSCSDLANMGITSTGRDTSYATINILGVVLSAVLAFAGIFLFGLEGAGIASLATAAILLCARLYSLAYEFQISENAIAPEKHES